MSGRNWSKKEVENTLIRLGLSGRMKDGTFIGDKCAMGLGANGTYHIYLFEGNLTSIKKEFKSSLNIEIHKSGRFTAL